MDSDFGEVQTSSAKGYSWLDYCEIRLIAKSSKKAGQGTDIALGKRSVVFVCFIVYTIYKK